jgi:hypothetical protein
MLPASDRVALFTMNILPPLALVWHAVVRRSLGDRVDAVIFDCSGRLDPRDFPGVHVQRFLNLYAATKCDEFLRSLARSRHICWLCDDDMFPLSACTLDVLTREFAVPRTASVSFRPRPWWHFEIEGNSYEPSGSYCLALDRRIFVEREHLSLAPRDGNTHPSHIGKPTGRYDTFDAANEALLRRGYRCSIVPEQERRELVAGFSGLSGGVVLLEEFRTPEALLDFYRTAPSQRWRGNVLFGTLQALLSIAVVQDIATALTGRVYPLPSLPSRDRLLALVEEHRGDVRGDHSIASVLETERRLREFLL